MPRLVGGSLRPDAEFLADSGHHGFLCERRTTREGSEHLAGIEDALGIQRVFDRAHGRELSGAAAVAEDLAFEAAGTRLGRDRAAIAAHQIVDDLLDGT